MKRYVHSTIRTPPPVPGLPGDRRPAIHVIIINACLERMARLPANVHLIILDFALV